MAKEGGNLSGTLMFVFKKFTEDDIKPHATTLQMNYYDAKSIEPILKKIKTKFPASDFSLEMLLYARLPEHKGNVYDIFFGALDSGGSSLYSIYSFNKKGKTLIKKKKIGLDNYWVPPISKNRKLPFEPIKDKFLHDIMVMYHLFGLEKEQPIIHKK